MKKFIQITTALLLCAVFFFVIGNPQAVYADEGNVYNIRMAVGQQYICEAFIKAGEVLNARLEAEGSKDRVNVETMIVDSMVDAFNVFSREDNMPELAVDSISNLRNLHTAGYTINGDFVINDEAYQELSPAMRALGLNYYDHDYYDSVTFDTEFRMVMIFKPALQQLGWTEEQIEQWKQDARDGKLTTAGLQEVAKQVVDAGICEFGITHRPEKCADNRYFFITFTHGIVPTDEDGKIIIRKNEINDYLTYWRTNVQLGLTPYNFMTDYNADMLYNDILPKGKSFAYYGHIEIKNRMMKGAGLAPEYIDENYFSIPAPVTREGDLPACGSNPRGVAISTSVEKDPQLKEYTRMLLDSLLDDDVQLDISLRSGHVAILDKTMETDEYKADKWMYDTDYASKYIFGLPGIPMLSKYGNSQELYDAYQEAELKALDPKARPIEKIVDEVVELMTFNMDDGSYIVTD